MQEKEAWKDIPDFEGIYMVSNLGRVKSLERVVAFGKQKRIVPEKILKPKKKKNGYLFVCLYKNRKAKYLHIHRLVAICFCEGYFEGADVNHKDGNKENNIAINLEWCTRSYNIRHSFDVLNNSIAKPILQYSRNGAFIKEWKSAVSVEKELPVRARNISHCLRKEQRTAGGFVWKYKHPKPDEE